MRLSQNFICATREYTTYEKFVPAPYLRKTFFLTAQPKKAPLFICGLGFYELHINGKDITKGKLAPYISNTDEVLYYDYYDLAPYLTVGKNVIAVQLGNGFQNNPGGNVWEFDTALWRSAPKLALSMEAILENGAVFSLESDNSFVTAPSPLIFDDFRLGVKYDANLDLPGWDAADFDDSAWAPALAAEKPHGAPVIANYPQEQLPWVDEKPELTVIGTDVSIGNYPFSKIGPIALIREFGPVAIKAMRVPTADIFKARAEFAPETLESEFIDGYLYDFGTNQSGSCRLKIKGQKGQKLRIWFGEALKNGKYIHSITFCRPYCLDTIYQTMEYTCKGADEEIFEPNFTFFGYQYAFVSGITEEQATPELLTYLEMHSDMKVNGHFSCSDSTLNKLQEMTCRSTASNFFYFPSDCPHREKNGWTADASLSAEQALLNWTPENYYQEWLRNIRKSQNEAGALPGIVPTTGWGFDWGNGPAWDNILVNLPYFTYLYRGNVEILKENAASIFRYVHYLTTRMDEKGLLAIGLGDWCDITSAPKSPLIFTDSVVSLDICRKAAFIFGVLHMDLQQKFCLELADRLRSSIRKYLIDFSTMTAIGNCQTSQAMAIFYDVLEPGEKKQALEVLLSILDRDGNHLNTGVLGARVLFHVLSAFGYTDRALQIITNPTAPSYAYWVKEGFSTLRESMHPVRPDNIPSSVNHHFWGDISHWFYSALAGIRVNPYGLDYKEINICPQFATSLEYVTADYSHPLGKIAVEWRREGKNILLTLTIPEGITGEVRLNNGWTLENKQSQFSLASGAYLLYRA